MAQMPPQEGPKFQLTKMFWIGVGGFALGTGPLLITLLLAALGFTKDPNPNPIGFGILAFLTIWPSVGLMIAGLAASISRYRATRRR
jgi:hypothetical protein